MTIRRQITITTILVILLNISSFSQGKFKAGLGYNIITNDFEQQRLEAYTAPSLHFSYTFLRKSKFSMALETATSFKSDEEDVYNSKFGFTSSLPLMFQLDLRKINVYVGTGPAYFKQRVKAREYNELVSEYYINSMIGVGIPLKQILGDFIYLELNPRITYLKSFKGERLDAGMLSLAVFLRTN